MPRWKDLKSVQTKETTPEPPTAAADETAEVPVEERRPPAARGSDPKRGSEETPPRPRRAVGKEKPSHRQAPTKKQGGASKELPPRKASGRKASSAGKAGAPLTGSPAAEATPSKAKGAVPERKSIMQRMAEKEHVSTGIVESSVELLSAPADTTASFRVDVTGALVPDEFAPLPVEVERTQPQGELEPHTATAYHLLALPDEVSPDDLEALTVSVWNEAGWLAPGVLRLREGTTLEGPWSVGREQRAELGLPRGVGQVWRVVCPPQRGAAPLPEVLEFDIWARAFPDGMPVGSELTVLQVLSRVARRLHGSLRIAGSGFVMTPDPEAAVNLRVFSDRWLPPQEAGALLEPYLPGVHAAQPFPEEEGGPYAFLAPAGGRSQILIGVRQETFLPRALRWELWSKGAKVYVYELVWAPPEDLMGLEANPTRTGLLERRRVLSAVETAAAALVTALPQSAIIDEDGFLLALDEPHQEEEPQHP